MSMYHTKSNHMVAARGGSRGGQLSRSPPGGDVFVRGHKQKSIVLQSLNKNSPIHSFVVDEDACTFWDKIKGKIQQEKQSQGAQSIPENMDDLESSLVVSGNFSNLYISPKDTKESRQDVSNNNKTDVGYYGQCVASQKQVSPSGELRSTFTFKLLVIGDPGCGKTSLVQKYVHGNYSRDYKATLGVDFALKVIPWSDTVNIKLQLWDIAGQERFTSMTRVYYKDAHACVIMFDLSQRSSFLNALKWKKDLDQKCTLPDGSPVPCILLANKCDLVLRETDQTEIEGFCRDQNFIGWTETSVKQGLMVDESMRFLLDDMIARYAERKVGIPDSPTLDRHSNVCLTEYPPFEHQKKCAC